MHPPPPIPVSWFLIMCLFDLILSLERKCEKAFFRESLEILSIFWELSEQCQKHFFEEKKAFLVKAYKQLTRLCSKRKTTTNRLKRSSESRGIRLWRARMGAVWAEGDDQRKYVALALRL